MKRFFGAIRRFFLPPADAKTFTRILPLFAVAFIVILLFAFSNYAWEQSNSPSFCGLTCHTMPPEYVTYQQSPHTNVTCEDCHMGRDTLPVMIQRKITYSWQTGSAMVFGTYEFPIIAKNMAPARDACENCHKPEKFSSDKLVEIKHYAEDEANTATSTFLALKTGGGTQREGLGFGIHWHIENPVAFYATDKEQQDIPYVVVTNPDGTLTGYTDIEANFDPATIKPGELKQMDCITCHNRTAHEIASPQKTMDQLISRSLVSEKIPEIKKKGVEVLSASYASSAAAMDGIAALSGYYKAQQPDFYTANAAQVDFAVKAIQDAYNRTNFVDQKANWQTHPNNLTHSESPGCFRCHDGKHMAPPNPQNVGKETIRLECNLCHSIPVVSGAQQITANLQLNKGFEPDSHTNSNWISLHREVFSPDACSGCHTTDDPGGVSNTSFCSNSVCHGATWKFTGFDAPKVREALMEQAKAMITPTLPPSPTPQATATQPPTATAQAAADRPTPTAPSAGDVPASVLFYETDIAPVLTSKCGSCHGAAAMKGLNVTTYATLMKGASDGPVVLPGDPDKSKIVEVQKGASHPGKLSADELDLLITWIRGGALEK